MKVQYSQPEYRVKNPYTPSQTYTQPNLVQSTPVVSNSIQSNPRIIGYHTVNLKDKNYQRTPHKTVLQVKSKSQHAESLGQSNNPITLTFPTAYQILSVNLFVPISAQAKVATCEEIRQPVFFLH